MRFLIDSGFRIKYKRIDTASYFVYKNRHNWAGKSIRRAMSKRVKKMESI